MRCTQNSRSESEASGIGNFLFYAMNLISQFAQVHFRKLLILQLLYQGFCVFAIYEVFETLDVALVVLDPFAKSLNVVAESRSLCCSLGLYLLSTPAISF